MGVGYFNIKILWNWGEISKGEWEGVVWILEESVVLLKIRGDGGLRRMDGLVLLKVVDK